MFRAGEQGRFWYAVLGGQLEVRYHAAADGDTKVSFTSKPTENVKLSESIKIFTLSFKSVYAPSTPILIPPIRRSAFLKITFIEAKTKSTRRKKLERKLFEA